MRTTKSIVRTGLFAALAGVAVFGADARAAEGDAAHGAVLAERWCASCHVVTAGQTRSTSDAPSFLGLADGRMTPEALADFLTLPGTTHRRMPDLSLSRVEIADIVAYVFSLKK